jgi:two-component system, OmpR family, response regulator
MRVLLVEDNIRLGKLLCEGLRDEGHAVDFVSTAGDFRSAAVTSSHDVYVIDLGLPDCDGLQLIADARAASNNRPILVITARASISDRVSALDRGADDYLVKPFHHAEFLARIRALLRRPLELRPLRIGAGHLVLDTTTGEISRRGETVYLTSGERRLLTVMMQHFGKALSRNAIGEHIWDCNHPSTPNATEQLVLRVRRVLRRVVSGLEIRTVRGIGYMLEKSHEALDHPVAAHFNHRLTRHDGSDRGHAG